MMPTTPETEGYVKFMADHTTAPAIPMPHWDELNQVRTHLHRLGLIGINSDGIGFGNVSMRFHGNVFLISGTATGALPELDIGQYCLVISFDIGHNHIVSEGPVQASSESMSHGAVYQARAGIKCVMHIHSRAIFDGMIRDSYPATPESAAYGTPEIASAIGQMVIKNGKDQGQIVLAGHDEGVIVYGPSVETTLHLTKDLYTKYGG